MNYIIAIDSDGTLRRSDGEISKCTKEAISKQIKKKNVVVICTARPRYHTLKISNEAGASNYLISSNGSEIFDSENQKIIWATYLKAADCQKLYDYAQANNLRIMFVLENTEYVTRFVRNNSQILLTEKNLIEVLEGKVKQAMIIGKEKEKIMRFKKIVQTEYKMNILDSSKKDNIETWFSVVSNDASKGRALLKLAEYLNISSQNIIAIGNDNNDISMFKIAKISAAVSNGTKETLKNADIIIKSNDEDGVALFLDELGFINTGGKRSFCD